MVEYLFTMDDGQEHKFEVDPHRSIDDQDNHHKHAKWTGLGFHQCKNCTLDANKHPRCPTAIDIEGIATKFTAILSYEESNVCVKTPQRNYSRRCDVQSGLSSLFGLVMATSGCPILSQLRCLAHYHLPFATQEETIFRTVGAYLLKQYFVVKKGGIPDLELFELSNFYEQLKTLNASFTERVRAASKLDANINAILHLFYLSELVSISLEDNLKNLSPLFLSL